MIIKEITMKNFHGFKERHITFSDQFTVLVGNNGTGKTAVLDGLAVALGSYLSGLNGVHSRHIKRDEIYREIYIHGGLSDIQMQFPVTVSCRGYVEGEYLEWSRSVNSEKGSNTSKEAKPIMEYASKIQSMVSKGQSAILPVISYYGTGRLWVQKKDQNEKQKKSNRLEGYSYCLDPASHEKHFLKWIEKMTYIELQRKEAPTVLSAVKKAISTCMKDWETLEFDVDSEELRVIGKDNNAIPFRLLSDGIRNTIGLVADLAHRMAQLNPALKESVVELTPGVVLIDELDLHLHPSWQRRIISDLKRTFPKVQFITTTHSPFIIQSLEEGELRRLHEEDDDEVVSREEFVNRSIEDITENVMEIPYVQRSQKQIEMYNVAQQYYKLLKEGKNISSDEVENIKNKLDDLESLYSEDIAYYAFLQMERKAAGLEREEDETN
ncbi:AAA ATPase [Exiguobacterium sibiricum 255-15]|uniref:AAA ATPase n=1 Tax=Exiguobacterium sibiricum (strain DSM 17290 / CCUG 55495 / CIP 109462 / JCM 13490 / 255-15) TaxID=262543 RepID=B1YIC1_EXIS2|nr:MULTISPECIES: AAA family ATPase [Exiguobacterium]ACB59804.1 AAA ATPase [Exiguobacterium sibiricum 255-15]